MKVNHWNLSIAATALATFALMAATGAKPPKADEHIEDLEHGVVVLASTSGSNVTGTVLLEQKDNVIHVRGEIRGLTPGLHGFHIHEYGDLRDPSGKSAGGHYNPGGTQHAGPDDEAHHVGDLGNIEADEQGVARVTKRVEGASLHFILGRSIVVHADEDDLRSQPSGNAGARVAVGVVGIAK